MKRTSILFAAAAAGAAAVVGSAGQAQAANASDFQVFNYNHADYSGGSSLALAGQLYVPSGYNPNSSQTYPLVVFFHGNGEYGTDNTKQINWYIDNLLAAAKSRNFFLYAPQTPNPYGAWQPSPTNTVEAADLNLAIRQIQTIITQYKVDTTKMYLTGLSYGGQATWNVYGSYRDSFAAAVPLSAAGYYSNTSWLAGKPVWSYVATNDSLQYQSRNAVTAMDTANGVTPFNFVKKDSLIYNGSSYYDSTVLYYGGNGTNTRYTEYATGGHSGTVWSRAYGEAPMYDWLLGQSVQPHQLQSGETIRIDLGPTSTTVANAGMMTRDSKGDAWNSDIKDLDYRTTGIVVPFCRTTTGLSTPVAMSMVANFSATRTQTSNSTLFDTTVTQDSWISSATSKGQVKLSGLTPGKLYSLSLFASDTDSDGTFGRLTRYTVQDASGSQFQDFDPVNNISNSAVFNVVADANGSIVLMVAPSGTARYGELSAISLTAVPEPTSLALLGFGMFVTGLRGRRSSRRA